MPVKFKLPAVPREKCACAGERAPAVMRMRHGQGEDLL